MSDGVKWFVLVAMTISWLVLTTSPAFFFSNSTAEWQHLLISVAHRLLKMPKDLALVMWVVDESFGVLPPSASKTSEPDLFVESKMTGKQCYEVQNLKISGKFWLCAILRAVSFNIQLKSLCTTLVGTHIVRLKFLKLWQLAISALRVRLFQAYPSPLPIEVLVVERVFRAVLEGLLWGCWLVLDGPLWHTYWGGI